MLVLLLSAGYARATPADTPPAGAKSALVMAGGAAEDERIYKEIVRQAGGVTKARIGVITASSRPESQDPDAGTPEASNSKANGEHYVKLFRKLGARHVEWIPIDIEHIHNNADPRVLARIRKLNAVFFGGGDQSRYLKCLLKPNGEDSPALAAIRRTYHRSGMVIAGTSAGTAVQVDRHMITGGESVNALTQKRVGERGDRHDLTYEPRGGLGFFPLGLLDTHFSERGRQGRLLRLAAETGTRFAFGVDENTALVLINRPGKSAKMKVVGENGVQVFDLKRAKKKGGHEWSLSTVKATYLTHGDQFSPAKQQIRFARGERTQSRAPLHAQDELVADIFSSVDNRAQGARKNPSAFAKLSSELAKSDSDSVVARAWRQREVRVRLSKQRGADKTRTGKRSRSYHNLRVDVRARTR